MTSSRRTQLLCILAAAVCVALASLMGPAIDAQRAELQLDPPEDLGGELAPEDIVLAAASGAFRGLMIDVMWYRAEELKNQGKFYEIYQLARWITRLQPRFAEVWRYHAWNMAYNISVATHTPEERWDWVNRGIAILRDQGIPNNPRSVNLYRELSWIFFHKVGQYSDDMHWYYRQKLAFEWQEVLGAPTRGATTEQAVDAFRRIAEAPRTLDELIEADPDAALLIQRLESIGIRREDLGDDLLREVGRIFMLNYLTGDSLVGQSVREAPQVYRTELANLLKDERVGRGLPGLLAYLRRRILVRTYHMDPDFMLELMERYGPLDWRHPAAHGAYWSERGMDIAEGVRTHKGLDLLNTNRQTVHAMQELASTGTIEFDPVTGYIDLSPDVRFIPAYLEAVEIALDRLRKTEDIADREHVYAAGHENFLLRSISYAYLYGDVALAQEYYDKTRELFGHLESNLRSGRYTKTLEDQVLADLGENLENWDRTGAFIDAMMMLAFQKGLANNRTDVFNHHLDLGRKVLEKFERKAIADPRLAQGSTRARMRLGDFDKLLTSAFERFMTAPELDPLLRVRVWRNAPLVLRQRVYDKMVAMLRSQMVQAGFDFDRAFPEPPGMAEYRQRYGQVTPLPLQESPAPETLQRN